MSIHNKRGVTLMELLAYLALVGIVITLLTGTMNYAVKSYNDVNGQGGIYTEADMIMSVMMREANSFAAQYEDSCGTNCVELVIQTKKQIDPTIGLIIEVPDYQTSQIKLVSTAGDANAYDIYIGGMKLNNAGYAIYYNSNDPADSGSIGTVCYDKGADPDASTCQNYILSVKLAIVRINSSGVIISPKPYIYENRFAF